MQLSVAPFLLALLVGGSFFAYAQQPAANSPEAQGHLDRVSFETWFIGLSGDQRRGAEFWSQERSKSKPVSCLATDGSSVPGFVAGCQEAQRRLALPDVRRRTESDYRKGWNAEVAIANAGRLDAAPAVANANSGSQAAPAEAENWYVGSPQDRTCFLTRDAFEGARTPEEVVATFKQAGIIYIIHRSDNGMITLHNISDPNSILALFKDKDFCQAAMKMLN